MNETSKPTIITDMQMVNWQYKEWYVNNSINQGILITQAQAAKILGKTRGRISQMISEKKLTSFVFEDETPLVSLAEISQMCDKEEKEYNKIMGNSIPEIEDETEKEKEAALQAAYDLENPGKAEAIKWLEDKHKKLKAKRDKIEAEMEKINPFGS